ncbi:MAG TPA: hypothetical protein VJC03_05745, partial [bacterium]|nr:hypothetical protein [bacterium]
MLNFSLFIIGFTALSSQIVLFRELLVIFYGNELTLGLMLGSWLLAGSAGSFLFSKKRTDSAASTFGIIQFCIALYLPASFFILRKIPSMFNLAPGEILNEVQIGLSSLLLLLPLNSLLSGLFVAGNSLVRKEKEVLAVGHVYILESMGAFCGGLLSALYFLPRLVSLQTLFILSVLNLIPFLFSAKKIPLKFLASFLILSEILLFPLADP